MIPYPRVGSRLSAKTPSTQSVRDIRRSSLNEKEMESAETVAAQPHVLSGSSAHQHVKIPPYMIPQLEAYTFLQMNWLYEIVKVSFEGSF